MKTTLENRQLSFEEVKLTRFTKYMQILEIIGNNEMTAREIETEMCNRKYSTYFDMNHVRPRLTELVNEAHELIECGVKEDSVTHKRVSVYRRTTIQEKMELDNMDHIPSIE